MVDRSRSINNAISVLRDDSSFELGMKSPMATSQTVSCTVFLRRAKAGARTPAAFASEIGCRAVS